MTSSEFEYYISKGDDWFHVLEIVPNSIRKFNNITNTKVFTGKILFTTSKIYKTGSKSNSWTVEFCTKIEPWEAVKYILLGKE